MEPGYVIAVCVTCFSTATAEPIADKFARYRINPSCFLSDATRDEWKNPTHDVKRWDRVAAR